MFVMGGRKTVKKLGKPAVACVVAGTLLIGMFYVPELAAEKVLAASSTQQSSQLKLIEESYVSAGVKLQSYRWTRKQNKETLISNVKVIIADLHNPNVKLDVMTGQNGKLTERANVLHMAHSTGAIAGINGDFFNMNGEALPLGPQVGSAELMLTPSPELKGMYAFGITHDNQPIIETFAFEGRVTAANGQSFPISGMNRRYSGNSIHLFTDDWGAATRNTGIRTPTEVLVVNNVVTSIAADGVLETAPPENGYILGATGSGAEFLKANLNVGDVVHADVSLKPVNPNLRYSEDDLKMLIGGHTMLVIDGKAASYTRDVSGIGPHSLTSRSAVGFTKDRRFVYLVAVEGGGDSDGAKLAEFQKLLIELGIWRAVNLDGGGSTTMVARPLGEFQAELINRPQDGSMRRVVNGIGVYSTAAPTTLYGLIVDGPVLLWKGQTARFSAKAYDTNYNPLDPATLPIQFKGDGSKVLKVSADGTATGAAAGTASIKAYSGDTTSDELTVEVLDQSSIVQLTVQPSKDPAAWRPGEEIQLQLRAKLANGSVGTIPAELVKWQQFGLAGTISKDGMFRYAGVQDGAAEAMLLAQYDGYSTPLAVPIPREQLLTDFNTIPWMITPDVYPKEAIGYLNLVGDENRSLSLEYNFMQGDGTKDLAAYVVFNGEKGISLSKEASALQLDVYGDGLGGWLRAEFFDGEGRIQRVTLADRVDWEGWKTVRAALPEGATALHRIYVVSKQPLVGQLLFDNLSLVFPDGAKTGEPVTIELTVGKKTFTVNGAAQQLDQAPIVEDNRTFVPIRFVVDTLGGDLGYDNKTKKVTIRKNGHYIELWIGKREMIADGARITYDVAPMIRNGRTMLPLRFVAEELDLKVTWDQAAKTIGIQE